MGCVEGELGCVDFQEVKSAVVGTRMMRVMDEMLVGVRVSAYVGFNDAGSVAVVSGQAGRCVLALKAAANVQAIFS